ncbi:MAG: GNAT family N-acetyltransferase [Gammaproteobacteria bacterium]|nr:GNAT family N-acetyltransferase [Gammaproteobacteria bacterium]
MNEDDLQIITTDWASSQPVLSSIRFKVFVEEQKVPKEMEIDDEDTHAWHFLVVNNNNHQPVATGRLLENGHIGRMAVFKEYRNRKVGSQLLSAIIDKARKQNIDEIFLNAQLNAVGFYKKNGFTTYGEEFMDAGIPHIKMTLTP